MNLETVEVPRNDSDGIWRKSEAGPETAIALVIMKNSLCVFKCFVFLSDEIQEKI